MYNINYYDDSANTCMYFNGHHAKYTHTHTHTHARARARARNCVIIP